MSGSIFDIFPTEAVRIKRADRGTIALPAGTPETVQAIVKRRVGMTSGSNNDELYSSATTLHFSPDTDIKIGDYVDVDGWRSVTSVKDGRDFSTGTTEFKLVAVGDDIIPETAEPVWGNSDAD